MSVHPKLQRAQVDAANNAFRSCSELVESDRILDDLAASMPGFDFRSCLIKAAAVDSIYFAGASEILANARRCQELLGSGTPVPVDASLVEGLALPLKRGGPGRWTNRVFASKFAHFFVNSSLPIMDSHACAGVALHRGLKLREPSEWPYEDFAHVHHQLAAEVGLGPSDARYLDKYLYIAGQLRRLEGGGRRKVWWEVATLDAVSRAAILGRSNSG